MKDRMGDSFQIDTNAGELEQIFFEGFRFYKRSKTLLHLIPFSWTAIDPF